MGDVKQRGSHQPQALLPLPGEGQVMAGCDEPCQSGEGNIFNKGMQLLGKKATCLQSQLIPIKDVEIFFPPHILVADDCVLLEKRLKEDVMWQKESGVWQWKLLTTWRGLTTRGEL